MLRWCVVIASTHVSFVIVIVTVTVCCLVSSTFLFVLTFNVVMMIVECVVLPLLLPSLRLMGAVLVHALLSLPVSLLSFSVRPRQSPVKIARLYLLSDVLHNSSAPVKKASSYRTHLQKGLPEVLLKIEREDVPYRTANLARGRTVPYRNE